MTDLPNPFLCSAEPSAEAAVTSSPPHVPPPDVTADQFDEPPLRDEPIPLFLTEPAPEMDRELEAMLKMLIAKRASHREARA